MSTIKTAQFGTTANGERVAAHTLENGRGMTVRVLDYGAVVQSITVPDREGRPTDVTLGYDDLAGYEAGSCFFGETVGRYANRIGNASFSLNGKTYRLPKNDGENHLHGCFGRRVFRAEESGGALTMRLVSPDGEEGFPGTVDVRVTFTLTEDNALRIDYRAVTDADTFVNLTNHTYFNLSGHGDVLSHRLRLNASRFTEQGPGCLPTGRILPVEGTALDFRREKAIGDELFSGEPQLVLCGGYDHNFIPDRGPEPGPVAEAWSPETGIALTFSATQPGVQFYSGNFVDGDAAPCGKGGVRYPRYGGFCLESQHFPDTPNRPGFPPALLRPGEEYSQTAEFRFGIKKLL